MTEVLTKFAVKGQARCGACWELLKDCECLPEEADEGVEDAAGDR